MINFKCSSCGKELQADPRDAGFHVQCPGCSRIVQIPAAKPKATERAQEHSAPSAGQATVGRGSAQEVLITGIHMPFRAVLDISIKFWLASVLISLALIPIVIVWSATIYFLAFYFLFSKMLPWMMPHG
jgi:DNA-directed RNA polymerase subunit RPC12/RpoP